MSGLCESGQTGTHQLLVLAALKGEVEGHARRTLGNGVRQDVLLGHDMATGEGREALLRDEGKELLAKVAHL